MTMQNWGWDLSWCWDLKWCDCLMLILIINGLKNNPHSLQELDQQTYRPKSRKGDPHYSHLLSGLSLYPRILPLWIPLQTIPAAKPIHSAHVDCGFLFTAKANTISPLIYSHRVCSHCRIHCSHNNWVWLVVDQRRSYPGNNTFCLWLPAKSYAQSYKQGITPMAAMVVLRNRTDFVENSSATCGDLTREETWAVRHSDSPHGVLRFGFYGSLLGSCRR